jgi:phospholipid N-methyltransferase
MPDSNPTNTPTSSDLLAHYLKNVRKHVPVSIEQIDMVLRLVGAATDRVERVLDLGSGDGVLTAAILGEHVHAAAVVLDLFPGTADAKLKLQEFEGRVTYAPADIAYPSWVQSLPQAEFDVIVCGFALQTLSDERKRALYEELWHLLRPEGIFLNIEHVASATRWSESVWDDTMIRAFFGQVLEDHPEKSRVEVAREYYEKARTQAARCAPFEVQLDWLRAAGFTNVDCYLKVMELALFGGQRPSASESA